MNPTTRRFLLLGLFGAIAMLGGRLTQGDLDPSTVGASPLGRKAPYRIEVTLDAPNLVRPFVHTVPLTRSQYEDVRFDTKKYRKRAIDEARVELAKKLGYTQDLYGAATKYENSKVREVLLIDSARENRRDGRVSILRDNPIPL